MLMLYEVSSRPARWTGLPSSMLRGRLVSNPPEGARAIFGVVGVTSVTCIATKAVATRRAAAALVCAAISLAVLLDDIASHDVEGMRRDKPDVCTKVAF